MFGSFQIGLPYSVRISPFPSNARSALFGHCRVQTKVSGTAHTSLCAYFHSNSFRNEHRTVWPKIFRTPNEHCYESVNVLVLREYIMYRQTTSQSVLDTQSDQLNKIISKAIQIFFPLYSPLSLSYYYRTNTNIKNHVRGQLY